MPLRQAPKSVSTRLDSYAVTRDFCRVAAPPRWNEE
jgi:hypothetical protein